MSSNQITGTPDETSLTSAPIKPLKRGPIAQGSVLMEEDVVDKKTGKSKKFMVAIPFNPTIETFNQNQDQENRPAFQFYKS